MRRLKIFLLVCIAAVCHEMGWKSKSLLTLLEGTFPLNTGPYKGVLKRYHLGRSVYGAEG